MTGVLFGVIHGAASNVRRARQQLTMGDVFGEGLPVEDASSPKQETGLPSSKSAAKGWDGRVGLAEADALLLCLKMKFLHNIRLVSTTFRTGNL